MQASPSRLYKDVFVLTEIDPPRNYREMADLIEGIFGMLKAFG